MSKLLFDTFRRILGRGMSQSEVDAINLALQQAGEQLAKEAGQVKIRTLEDPHFLFDTARELLRKQYNAPLTQARVDNINLILNNAGEYPIAWVAYILATAQHESLFEPIEEWGRGKGKKYGRPEKYSKAPYGRGFVQLTWDYNYEWADKALGLDGALLNDFDLALAPHLAARVIVKGMVEGAFTGKGLADYLGVQATRQQFKEARRIVNGRDKDELIAGYAVAYQDALVKGKWR